MFPLLPEEGCQRSGRGGVSLPEGVCEADGVAEVGLTAVPPSQPNPEMILDHPQYAFHIVHDIPILEAHDPYTEQSEVAGSRLIVFHSSLMIMCRAVEFHREALARAVEVQDVGSDAVLAPELAAR
jgi:hypothetical protein